MERGHETLVLCPPGSELASACEDHGVPVRTARMRSELDVPAVFRLASSLRSFGADVAHFHTARGHTLGLAASRLAGTPVKVLSRRVDFPVGGNFLSKIKYGASVDAVVAITRAVKDVLVAGGVSPESITVIHSGIDLEAFRTPADGTRVRDELGIPRTAPLVGAVGALVPHKAQSYLLRAAKKLAEHRPDIRYIIAGDGELESELRSLANSFGINEIVTFAGFRRDIRAVLSALDVFVLSSVAEGLCTSILDAMATGVPVIGTSVGGVPEIVVDGECGMLVPPADPESLASAIGHVLESPSLREKFVAAGRDRVAGFSVRRTIEETEGLYLRLLKEKRGGLN